MSYFRLTKPGVLWIALAGCLASVCASVSAQDIVYLVSDSLTSTTRTVRGATRVISDQHTEATFHEFYLTADPQTDLKTTDSVNRLNPRLIVTVGTTATQFARASFPETPIVFAAVIQPDLSGLVDRKDRPSGNITGASLDVPAEIQFRYFKQLIPELKSLGVLYTDNTEALIAPAAAAANRMGLNLVAIKVAEERDIPHAFDSLAQTVDGIWSFADPRIFSPQTTKFILLNSLKRGIPFMGFSRHVVESGALFALDSDYKAVGRQAGQIANRILSGGRVADSPVTVPDFNWFHYNERTAQHLNIIIPEELMAVAKEVYR